MVKKVPSYVCELDGRMFLDRREAVIYEARLAVIKVMIEQGCNDALATKVCERLEELSLITEPLAREIRKDFRERGLTGDPLEYYREPPSEDKQETGS